MHAYHCCNCPVQASHLGGFAPLSGSALDAAANVVASLRCNGQAMIAAGDTGDQVPSRPLVIGTSGSLAAALGPVRWLLLSPVLCVY